MSVFQVSYTATADDKESIFRTSLRSQSGSRPPVLHRKKSSASESAVLTTQSEGTPPREGSVNGGPSSLQDGFLDNRSTINRSHSASFRDSAFESMESPNRDRSVSRLSNISTRTSTKKISGPRRPRSAVPRSVSRLSQRNHDYDATIHNETPMVSRFNQQGEMYQPVSYAWQSFKERLFDSALSEKYENLQVDLPSRNSRRYRSVSPSNFDDDDSDDEDSEKKKLLFLQDPLSRSMYKNLEVFFDRKNLIRDSVGDLALPHQNHSVNLNPTTPLMSSARANFSFSRSNSSHNGFSARPHSALGGRPATSLDFRPGTSLGFGHSARGLESSRPQSSLDNHQPAKPSGPSSNFFSRRKREFAPAPRAHSEERPEDVRKKIQERFAQIDFNEGTTDYDALFTVTEEGNDFATQHDAENKAGSAGEGNAVNQAEDDKTPKARLEHLRY